MSPSELDELRGHLAHLVAILDEEGDAHWASWMRSSLAMLEDRDPDAIEHFLGAFGGMGSFNDMASERSAAIAGVAYRLATTIRDRNERT